MTKSDFELIFFSLLVPCIFGEALGICATLTATMIYVDETGRYG